MYAGAGSDLLGGGAGPRRSSLTRRKRDGLRLQHRQGRALSVQGYAGSPTITSVGGNTTMALSDHTQVTFIGVGSPSGSAFV